MLSIERVYNHLTTTFSVFIPLFIQTTLVHEWCFYKADLIIVNPSSIFFFLFYFFKFYFIFKLYVIVLVCQISKWIRHRYTCVPHPEPHPEPEFNIFQLILITCRNKWSTPSQTKDSRGTHPLYLPRSSLNLLWYSLKILFLLQGSGSSLQILLLQWVLWFAILLLIYDWRTYSFRYLHCCWKTKCSCDSPQEFPGLKKRHFIQGHAPSQGYADVTMGYLGAAAAKSL